MKKLFAVLVLCSTMATAQVHRFVYEYKYIPNINEKEKVMDDLMVLDIDEKGSSYESLSKLERDSAFRARLFSAQKSMGSGGSLSFSGLSRKQGTVEQKVVKEYPEYKTYLFEKVDSDLYKIAEEGKQDWKILSETQKIGNYTAQKATTSFGGRDWVAWFTTDLPFPDGPYKFHGLPGLIVKLEDTTGSHIMTMVANKKMPNKEEIVNTKKVGEATITFGTKEIPVTVDQFKKAWKNYIKDPAKNLREMSSRSVSGGGGYYTTNTYIMKDQNGKELDMKEMMKRKEESAKTMLKNNNNRIEPNLFKL
jgi:GLPGLI family protein